MLGLRAAIRSDSGISPAEIMFGTTLRLPGDFYSPEDRNMQDISEYVKQVRQIIKSLEPKLESHANSKVFFVHPDLQTCTHVFVRNYSVRPALQAPYDGPFMVICKSQKYFEIQLPNRTVNITIDRLKPAYLLKEEETAAAESSTNSSHEKQDKAMTQYR